MRFFFVVVLYYYIMSIEEAQIYLNRDRVLSFSDEELMVECSLDFFKSSGKGGQKRNKTSSAVRLIHNPTKVAVTDCSERSQHRNRQVAIQKLRLAIALQFRVIPAELPERIECGSANSAFYLNMARVLDVLCEVDYSLALGAERLGVSSSKLLKILAKEPQFFARLNELRKQRGLGQLHL